MNDTVFACRVEQATMLINYHCFDARMNLIAGMTVEREFLSPLATVRLLTIAHFVDLREAPLFYVKLRGTLFRLDVVCSRKLVSSAR